MGRAGPTQLSTSALLPVCGAQLPAHRYASPLLLPTRFFPPHPVHVVLWAADQSSLVPCEFYFPAKVAEKVKGREGATQVQPHRM